MSVLEVKDLSIRFGGLQALQDLHLEVNEYEIVGLIGPNGAGKTTAFNCITGFYTPDTGSVHYRGQDVTTAPPHVKAALGFGRTFQNVGMVKSATALENLKTAQHARAGYGVGSGLLGTGSAVRAERRLTDRAEAILDLLGLSAIRDMRVGGQSYGTLKLLELGCALATDPDILLLDEPTSGMGPDESEELGDRLLALRREFELTMLVIEHHVPLVLRVCDHVYVLNFGRLLAEGKPGVIQTHPEVVAAYLGGEAPEALESTQETEEDAALDAELGQFAQHGHERQPAAAVATAEAPAGAPADAGAEEHHSRFRRPRASRSRPAPVQPPPAPAHEFEPVTDVLAPVPSAPEAATEPAAEPAAGAAPEPALRPRRRTAAERREQEETPDYLTRRAARRVRPTSEEDGT